MTTTTIGPYQSIKGTAFSVEVSAQGELWAVAGTRRLQFRSVQPATAAAATQGATHCVRDWETTIALDADTAQRIAADIEQAQLIAADRDLAAAWDRPGARLCLDIDGSGYSIGVAYPAENRAAGVHWVHTTDKLPMLRVGDRPAGAAFGWTTQGSSLIEITEEEAARLRALDAQRAQAAARTDAAETAKEAAIATAVAEIPDAVVAERQVLRRAHTQGVNEGGDGYDPYASWLSPGSLSLLDRRAPDLAATLRALR